MQQDTAFPWQQALQDAIQEPDCQLARAKIANAEMAIFKRMQGFKSNGDAREERALFDALGTIRTLRDVRLTAGPQKLA